MDSPLKSPEDGNRSNESSIASAKGGDRPTLFGERKSYRESFAKRFHRRHQQSTQSDETPGPQQDQGRVTPISEHEPSGSDPESHSAPSERRGVPSKIASAFARNWRYLALACIFAGLTVFASLSITDALRDKCKSHEEEAVCTSPACVHAASEILYNLDPNYENLDPCNDFNQYVCGGWDQRHDLRPDQSSIFTGTLMNEASKSILRHILEDPVPSAWKTSSTVRDVETDNFDKLKTAYDACMDQDAIKNIGLAPLKKVVDSVKEIYSSSAQARHSSLSAQTLLVNDERKDLTSALEKLSAIGVQALISAYVGADDRDPDNTILTIAPPYSPGLPSIEYYGDKDLVNKYIDVATSVLSNQAFGAISGYGETGQLVRAMVDLETKLARVSPTTQEQQDVTYYYNPLSIKEIQSLLPQVDFESFIGYFYNGSLPDRVIVGSPGYLKNASTILDETPKEVIQTFLAWKTIQTYVSTVDDPAVKPLRRFENTLRGLDPDAEPERWRTCVGVVDSQLGWILSKYFVDAAFSPEAKRFGEVIINDIKTSFLATLKEATWMSSEVRQLAAEKVVEIDVKVGYPTTNPNILDPQALKDYYANLEISNSSYFDNSLYSTVFDIKSMWAKLGKPTRRDEWGMTAPTVNAYYNPPGNEIVFPAGIMQSPVFFDPSVPQYLSYGAFGSVSGHELSHAFDSTGRHYDVKGNYTNWWDEDTVAAFEEKAQCFVSQYGNFTVPGNNGEELHVNGRLTLGENIADAGGVAAAYASWKRRNTEAPNQRLPGLEKFTPNQLFFINYGSWWCGKIRKEAQIERIYTDPHAPTKYRISGTMDNSAEFKEAFGCAKKEPICKLW